MLTMRSRAALTVEPEESAIPEPGSGEVLVRLHRAGICASDSQIFHGRHKYMTFPVVQGHEGVGTVEAVGPNVRRAAVGDTATFLAQFSCGECHACRRGRENVCVDRKGLGVLRDGLFTEYFCCPESLVAVLPAGFTDELGVLAEPASVGVHAARVAGITAGDRAVVIGAGIIGNFTAQACRALGADVVIADLVEKKLETARKNGLPKTVDTGGSDLAKEAARLFGGLETTAVFDCAGVEATLNQAIALAGNARRVMVVANFKQPVPIEIGLFQRREVSLAPAMAASPDDFRETIRYLHEGKITVADLISADFPLRKLADAFAYIDDHAGETMKVTVTMQ